MKRLHAMLQLSKSRGVVNVEAPTRFIPGQPANRSEGSRETWSRKTDFILAVIGFAVDLGNVWRFPYICYRNGGGAFLIPYLTMYFLCGLPLFYMELALGQFQRCGCVMVWRRICPMFAGLGIGACIVGVYVSFYYNTIMAWSLYYLWHSLASIWTPGGPPWTRCDGAWNSRLCRTLRDRVFTNSSTNFEATDSDPVEIAVNASLSSSEEFFFFNALEIQHSGGFGSIGGIRWQIAFPLFVIFAVVYFSIWRGVRSTGKAVWLTATMPYAMLLILLIRGLTLDGSLTGIRYYLTPQWHRLLDVQVWNDAACQIFFSLGPGFGVLIALASYNKFNNNCYADALLTSSVNCATSLLSGFVVFSVLGNMALRLGKNMDAVASEGPGLVFMAYPEAIGTLSGAVLWASVFFAMLIVLGLDSTFGGLEAIITGISDAFPKLQHRRKVFVLCLLAFCFLGSLPTTTYGGFFVITLLDQHGAAISLLLFACLEAVAVSWFYGHRQFCDDIRQMLGFQPSLFWRVCWTVVSPALLLAVLVANLIGYQSRPIEILGQSIPFPAWAIAIGWFVTASSMVPIPAYLVYRLLAEPGEFFARFKAVSRPVEALHHGSSDEPTGIDSNIAVTETSIV